jgi:regulatory protein
VHCALCTVHSIVTDCYTAALRILNYRFNSEAELRRKLVRKKYAEAEIDDAIAKLREEKWLDDERFAGAFVRARTSKRIGPGRIRRELSAAGVDRETAAHALTANADDERTREHLTALFEKRKRMLARRKGDDYPATREGKAKIASYLIGLGYDATLVNEIVRHEDD